MRLQALLDGTLDPAIDPDPLLVVDLAEPMFEDVSLEGLDDIELAPEPNPEPADAKTRKKPRKKVRKVKDAPPVAEPAPDPPPPVDDATAFRQAVARLLRFPSDRLRARIVDARRRHADFAREQTEAQRRRAREERLRSRANKTKALLDGELPVEQDAAQLLEVDLEVLAHVHGPAVESPPDTAPAAPDGPNTQLAVQLEQLLAMNPEARRAVLEAHQKRQLDAADETASEVTQVETEQVEQLEAAEEAARLRKEALEDAARARSELERARAEELARMRGVQEDLANHAASLQTLVEEAKQRREWVLEFRRHVRDLKSAQWTRGYDSAEADMRYADAVKRLKTSRTSFRELLERARQRGGDVPSPGDPDEALWEGENGEPLRTLHQEVLERHNELVETTADAVWTALKDSRDDMVSLNELRLELLTLSSAANQAAMTGLGPEGVAQARREFEQIGLELNYQALTLPHTFRQVRADARVAPIPVAISIAKLVLSLLLFRWWRRRGPEWIEAMRISWTDVRPQTRLTRVVSGACWYLLRIHRPLEWLVLAVILVNLPDPRYLPEVSLLKILVVWTLGGMTVLRLLDAIASREDIRAGRPDEVAQLRVRSLAVVGWTIIGIGLMLSLTVDLVGAGAIYGWVARAAWIVALPLVAMLVAWWKPTIYVRFRQDASDTAFRKWVLDKENSWLAYPVALLGGGFILVRQVGRAIIRQASGAETTRRVLAYLFRREVAKRAQGEGVSSLAPVDSETLDRIRAVEVMVDSYANEELEQLVAVAGAPNDTLSVVVGPRGVGKSMVLGRLSERLPMKVVTVKLQRDGEHLLVEQLRQALTEAKVDVETPAGQDLPVEARTVVLVDDVHLCMQPSVGGMKQLDEFVDFAREASSSISWVFTTSAPSWQYISRARGDTMFLDQVIRLPPWSEDQIRELTMNRTRQAGVEPSFEDLVVPRQFDDRDYDEAERTQVGYFRILWDTSAGNPEVAMHFWLRSLHAADDGVPHVRLFVEPSTRDLERVSFNALFVLRAILQMEWAASEQLISCTRLGRADVLEALRYCRSRGYLEQRGPHYRITLHWHQPISRLLGRQHLLAA